MRRSDREIKNQEDILNIIKKCDACRIAMFDEDYPYMVAMNFGEKIIDNTLYLYFHCAQEGKKLDLLKKNNKVFFEMDCSHQFILYEERMSCTMGYESVMGQGIVEFVDEEDKFEGLKVLMKHYHEEDFEFNTKMMKVTTVFRIKVISVTAKKRDNVHKEEKVARTLEL